VTPELFPDWSSQRSPKGPALTDNHIQPRQIVFVPPDQFTDDAPHIISAHRCGTDFPADDDADSSIWL
jgi:hypothetical protein